MACGCLYIQWNATTDQGTSGSGNFQPSGSFQNNSYYEFIADGITYFLYYDPFGIEDRWYISTTLGGTVLAFYIPIPQSSCPIGGSWGVPSQQLFPYTMFTSSCDTPLCVPIEDRHKRKYDAVQLPVIFDAQNRGWKGCCDCEPMPTLASPDPETWKNDITSAWIKMSDPTDVVMFKMQKNGVDTIYQPTINAFINESDAYYTTVNWIDVLNADGVGCYELIVEYNISGVIGSFIWGAYNLKPYTIQNALQTARIRVKFNLQQEIENINFTGTNIEDTIRFYGFIGERQPNTEIDNLIYNNRGMKTVVRENLNTYKITTDPSGECLLTKLTDLYLLSENEMYISDYNAHNHSYKYLDLPVIVKESSEIDYLDILQRKAILTCEVADRSKNQRTFY